MAVKEMTGGYFEEMVNKNFLKYWVPITVFVLLICVPAAYILLSPFAFIELIIMATTSSLLILAAIITFFIYYNARMNIKGSTLYVQQFHPFSWGKKRHEAKTSEMAKVENFEVKSHTFMNKTKEWRDANRIDIFHYDGAVKVTMKDGGTWTFSSKEPDVWVGLLKEKIGPAGYYPNAAGQPTAVAGQQPMGAAAGQAAPQQAAGYGVQGSPYAQGGTNAYAAASQLQSAYGQQPNAAAANPYGQNPFAQGVLARQLYQQQLMAQQARMMQMQQMQRMFAAFSPFSGYSNPYGGQGYGGMGSGYGGMGPGYGQR